MQNIIKIMLKELLRWLNMAGFYVLFALLLFSVGLYTWFFNEGVTFFDIDRIMPACLRAIYWGLAVFMPLLAVGLVMEEKRTKMFKVLLSKPLSVQTLILGKLAAVKLVLFVFLFFTLFYYFSIAGLTKVTLSYLLLVYLFLFLMGVTYAAISMAVASFFSTYWRSYLFSYAIIFLLHTIANVLGDLSMEEVQAFFNYVSVKAHFEYFLAGGFALSTLIYLTSLILVAFYTTVYKLSRDNS